MSGELCKWFKGRYEVPFSIFVLFPEKDDYHSGDPWLWKDSTDQGLISL